VIIQVLEQRGLDVISERGRDVGDGADDPAEPLRRRRAACSFRKLDMSAGGERCANAAVRSLQCRSPRWPRAAGRRNGLEAWRWRDLRIWR
jgi:hypothetical protein